MRTMFDRQLAKARRETGEVDLEVLADLVTRTYDEAAQNLQRTEKLAKVHQQLLDAFDVVPEGIALFDLENRYVMWNRGYAEIYGKILDTIDVGARFEDVVRAALAKGLILDAVGREEEWLAKRLAEHQLASHTYEHHMQGDKWVRVVERRTADGGRVSVRTDITELKQREASFRLLFESNPIPMFVCNAKTLAFLAANEAAALHYGYPRQQLLNMSIYDLRRPEDREELKQRALAGDAVRPQKGTIRPHIKADGTQIDVAIYSTPMSYQGEPAVIFAAVDVTERQLAGVRLREQKFLTDTAVNNITLGLVMFGAEGRLVLWNQHYIDMYGLSPDVVKTGASHFDLMKHRKEMGVFSGDPEAHCHRTLARVAEGKAWTLVLELPDGRSIQMAQRPMADGGWVSTHEDITERRGAEIRLRDQKLQLDTAVGNMAQGLLMFSAEGKLVLWNQRYIDMYGLSPDVIKEGVSHLDLVKHKNDVGVFSGGDPETHCLQTRARLADGNPWIVVHALADGRSIQSTRCPMPNGGWLSTHEDITERLHAEKRMAHMAHHDPLTDLPNRALFRQQLEKALNSVSREGSLAVLFIDLDNFKIVNDTLGHSTGDELLKSLATRLRDCVRETDILARLGGDEFAIVQTALTRPEDASGLAVRLRDIVKRPFEIDGQQISIDFSIGIAMAPHDGDDADQLVKNADMALYAAKGLGRGTFHFFETEMDARVKARRRLELDLRRALPNGEFELHYQPIISLESNAVCGFEALLRWRHPDRGMVLPDGFIALAEELGLLGPIGDWVLRTACAEATTWPHDIKLAVNLSPAELADRHLAERVSKTLATTGLQALRLELEITERALLQETEALSSNLRALRECGVQLVMDDFGVGYCSLNYLRSFPFDKIKIDRSFVRDIGGESQATAIVRAVISLARSLNMATTAEGVETQQQLEAVRALGCTEVQGYLFNAPMRIANISGLTPPSVGRKATAA